MLHHWSTALDNGDLVRALFVDYSKAFDRVDHSTLLNKMTAISVPKLVVRWLYSFLDNRQQRVKLSSSLSDWTLLTGGMPQGSWLGPLIFIIYIDDLHPSCTTHKFMDDVTLTEVITKGSNSADSNMAMAHYISHLELWARFSKNLRKNPKFSVSFS